MVHVTWKPCQDDESHRPCSIEKICRGCPGQVSSIQGDARFCHWYISLFFGSIFLRRPPTTGCATRGCGTSRCSSTRRLFLHNTALMIPKEGTPAPTAEHEGLHKCSLSLHGVHQIVTCPCMKHLC